MTVTYSASVASASFSCFLKLLARWKGSIYKLLWRDFAVFAIMYFTLQFVYRFVLDAHQRKIFELISHYCESNNALIPVAFVLGFYVSLIMSRWWGALNMIPWPDHMAMFVTANVHDLRVNDNNGRLIRRTMMRYLCLSYVMTMTCISTPVKKRFPDYTYMVKGGLMTEEEREILSRLSSKNQQFFIPLAWTTNLVRHARSQNRIKEDYAQKTLIDEINEFRRCLATLMVYDWVTVPLVYTQVVTIAVYMFFVACLMGRQFLLDDPSLPDLYFPLFTFLEFFFYMGWLKVAECLVNPFGEDEDDFEINLLIDRNLQVAYMLVDEMRSQYPQLEQDTHWDQIDCEMPYTKASAQFRSKQSLFQGSTWELNLREEDKEIVVQPMEPIEEDEDVPELGDAEERDDRDRSKSVKIGLHRLSRQPSADSTYSKSGLYGRSKKDSYNKYEMEPLARSSSPHGSAAVDPDGRRQPFSASVHGSPSPRGYTPPLSPGASTPHPMTLIPETPNPRSPGTDQEMFAFDPDSNIDDKNRDLFYENNPNPFVLKPFSAFDRQRTTAPPPNAEKDTSASRLRAMYTLAEANSIDESESRESLDRINRGDPGRASVESLPFNVAKDPVSPRPRSTDTPVSPTAKSPIWVPQPDGKEEDNYRRQRSVVDEQV